MKRGINIRAGFDLKAFSTSSQNLTRSLKKTANQMKSIGKTMSTYVTAPLVAMGALSTKVFAEFEQSMAKVAAVSGATGEELKKLTDLSKQLGISTRFTASEVSGLQLNYAKLGFTTSEIEKITEATLQLALATGEELADSAEVAGATLRGFNKPASEMQNIVDLMAKSFSSSALNLERFSTSMGKIAPVANAAGVEIENVVAMQSALVDSGVDASTVGTSLRKIFIELATKGISYEDAMNKIRTSTDKVTTANKLFGARAFASAIILSDQQEKVSSLTAEYKDSAGAAGKMAAVMDNTLQGSMFKLKSAVEGLGISFGEVLAPHVAKVANFASNLAIKFSELSPRTKKIILVVGGLVAAIGPLIVAVGALTTAFAFLAANPIVLIITAIIAAMAAFAAITYYVYQNWDALVERFTDVTAWRNALIDIGQMTMKFLVIPLKHVILLVNKILDYLGTDIEISTDGIDLLVDSMSLLKGETKEYKTTVKSLSKVFGDLKKKAMDAISTTTTAGTGMVRKQLEAIKHNLSIVKDFKIPVTLDMDISKMPQMIKQLDFGVSAIGQKISDFKESVKQQFTQFASTLGVFLGETLGNAISGGFNSKDFGSQALMIVGDFMKQMGALMITYAAEMALFNTALANPALWPVALAAGIAMVAAGTAISNHGQKGLDSGGGSGSSSSGSYGSSYNALSDFGTDSLKSIVTLSGREMLIVQERENTFRR